MNDPLRFDEESVAFPGRDWLLEFRRLELDGTPCERRSPDGESFLLVLTGTHDLYAGGGSWLQRGLREEPFSGRPLGVFLPPSTPYRLENGSGRALVLSVRQPRAPEPATPKEALSKKPLLPMAGSGKAFDPATGTWKPQEAFLASPEAILPRRIERVVCGPVTIQRVLDAGYKALGLMLDEASLADGDRVRLPVPEGVAEGAIYFEAEGELDVGGTTTTGVGCAPFDPAAPLDLEARGGRVYVAAVYAGPKPPTR